MNLYLTSEYKYRRLNIAGKVLYALASASCSFARQLLRNSRHESNCATVLPRRAIFIHFHSPTQSQSFIVMHSIDPWNIYMKIRRYTFNTSQFLREKSSFIRSYALIIFVYWMQFNWVLVNLFSFENSQKKKLRTVSFHIQVGSIVV